MENLFSNTFVLVIVGGLLLILVVVFILLMSKKKKNIIEEDNSLKSSPIPDLESLNKESKPCSEQSFNMQLSQSENLSSNSDDFVPLSQLVPEINSNVLPQSQNISSNSFEQKPIENNQNEEIIIEDDIVEPIIDVVDSEPIIDIVEPISQDNNVVNVTTLESTVNQNNDLFNSMFGQSINNSSNNDNNVNN